MRSRLLALLLTSCASVKKATDKLDSTVVKTFDSVRVIVLDSVTKIVEKEEYFTKTITYYDTLWVTKDSMITVPKYTETYTKGTKEKQTDSKQTKTDSMALNRTETTQISKITKNKDKSFGEFYKALIALILIITLILFFWRRK
jgi:ATP-dependent Zn protease